MMEPGSRRSFLRSIGVGGAAVVGAAGLVGVSPALAQTGTAPGPAIDSRSLALSRSLAAVEVAAADSMAAGLRRRLLTTEAQESCRAFQAHHLEHADALVELAGSAPGQLPDADAGVMGTVGPRVAAASDAASLLAVLSELEQRVAATAQATIEQISDATAAGVVARVLAVDAQQATVLAQQAGEPSSVWLPRAQTSTGAFAAAVQPA